MTPIIAMSSEPQPDLDTLLDERIYQFNSEVTGIFDGRSLSASVVDDAGEVIAALSGHTWGGCCEITRLWVNESSRGTGIGTALMDAATAEAMQRGCTQIVLSTHSFQAPGFYENLGFARVAAVPNYPRGHENIIYLKRLS